MVTARDRVWAATIDVVDEHRTGFRSRDVYAAMDEPPSMKTIQRVLRSMAELGLLRHRKGSPRYSPGEKLR